ncbi:alpha-mannosidase [Paenibacillus yanchengensis]|uniref:Alpha-mannosidase n=1 Tax=Paenibacillus yanchengensis TaxID=2035833 RepID=A0ABW4YG92_9BACL
MTVQKTAHIIAHSHWDREWYMPFETHRLKLVELLDRLLEQVEEDMDYGSFHLDGQTLPLDDYLEIRPDKAPAIKRLVEQGKLIIGPFYILQDEFLISSEANVRNVLIGITDAEKWGSYAKVGYFPDSFGNMGQAPQIILQAGIDTAVYGRGVKAVGFNNEVGGENPHISKYSEMYWQSPDGSKVLAILFANWYHNGMEIPENKQEALAYWNERLPKVEAFASTSELLFMNGCDHQPLQTNLSQAIKVAGEVRPDIQFKHSSFPEYIEAVKARIPADLATVHGELRSQWTDGWGTLVNTASARVYLKQANVEVQTLLENVAEPLAVLAHLSGASYPREELVYAWKTLLQNHPHDSICGCSVDEVHQEMMTRFAKSKHMAEALMTRSLQQISDTRDTSIFAKYKGAVDFSGENGQAAPFLVFNTSGYMRSGAVKVVVDVCRRYFSDLHVPVQQAYKELQSYRPDQLVIINEHGMRIDAEITHKGLAFGYDLPDDRFRQPYWAYQVEVTLFVEDLHAFASRGYALVSSEHIAVNTDRALKNGTGHAASVTTAHSIVSMDGKLLENDKLKIDIADDGSFSVEDKTTGRTYTKLGLYEDTGDLGNEYMYKQPDGEAALTTEGLLAQLEVVENSELRGVVRLTHRWMLPLQADALLEEEIASMTPFKDRKAQRVAEQKEVLVQTTLTLERGSRALQIGSTIDNTVLDHRIRMLFPTTISAEAVTVDSIYELATRSIQPEKLWTNPSNAQHQQSFVSISDGEAGVTVANIGLHEYEALADGTLAITLLRGVRELGDWGVFATPEAQCLGTNATELSIIFHDGDVISSKAYVEAYQLKIPWVTNQTTIHQGDVPVSFVPFQWQGEALAVTALKVAEKSNDVMFRLFNTSLDKAALAVQGELFTNMYKSNIIEANGESLERVGDSWTLAIGPAEIVTVGLQQRCSK